MGYSAKATIFEVAEEKKLSHIPKIMGGDFNVNLQNEEGQEF